MRLSPKTLLVPCTLLLFLAYAFVPAMAQDAPSPGKALYDQIKAFSLTGGSVTVSNLNFNRDRVKITLTGTIYFAAPVNGRYTGAVFVGDGTLSCELPPNDFEKENVQRLLGASIIDSDFKTAVFRFSDDTFERLAQKPSAGVAGAELQKVANEHDERILKEIGANVPERVALSILNKEQPGFFFATFAGGRRGRFSFVLDSQSRIPVNNFVVNAGEKGLFYKYDADLNNAEVWLAFYSEQDYARGSVYFADVSDQIDVTHYDLDVDLRDHKNNMRMLARVKAEARFPNLQAIAFRIGEDLGETDQERLKKQLRLKQARLGDQPVSFVQEDWEGGFAVFLPEGTNSKNVDLTLLFEGDFMQDAQSFIDRNYFRGAGSPDLVDSYYPRSTTSWLPTHGYLDRATFSLTFRHPKKLHIAAIGQRLSEEPDVEDKNATLTKYEMKTPVALGTFALGPFERHKQLVRWDKGGVGEPIEIEFSSLPGSVAAIKEDFILAELDNSLRYFTTLFGKYPYAGFGATFHPYFFGQGFPSLLMIPGADRANKHTYAFIAHETAHQWWGNIVAWRSYRDQWLSEGFAEYSGMLYTGVRSGSGSRDDLINEARSSLKLPPRTLTGVGKGRLVDVGPLVLGHRLSTTKTRGAYATLIYNKGALVLRMLHSLFTDPSTGNGDPFFAMMTDFVNRHRNGIASTDDFRVVANEHFVKTPIARTYGITSLDWFFNQWVYQSYLPSYQMDYKLEDQPDGKVLMSGTITQEHAPASWFMVLPVGMTFGGKTVFTTVVADGPKATFKIRLPARPSKVELDPDRWILSDNTSTHRN